MKKRVKIKAKSINKSKQKRHSLPVILFTLVLVFVVYSGVMNLLNFFISPNAQSGAVSDTGNLASFSPGNIAFALVIIFVLFAIFLFFIYGIKLKKKRRK